MSDAAAREDKRALVLEYTAALFLGIATIMAAVSGYFSALWGGVMSGEAQKAIYELSKSNTSYLEALDTDSKLDFTDFKNDYLYLEWQNALRRNDQEDANYLLSKMDPDQAEALESDDPKIQEEKYAAYDKAFEETLAASEKKVQDSLKTFESTQGMMKASQDANAYGDRYTFAVVLFTVVMFFAGMSAVAKRSRIKFVYIFGAAAMFIFSTIIFAMIPLPSFG